MSAQIFMCYTPQDKSLARYVAITLQTPDVTFRSHSMLRCGHFLLIWSAHAAESREVHHAIDEARAQGLPMVALIVGTDAPPPPENMPQMMCTTVAQALIALEALAQRYGLMLGKVVPPDAALFAPHV